MAQRIVGISWPDLSEGLNLNFHGPDSDILGQMAGAETRAFIESYEAQNQDSEPLNEEQTAEVKAAFLESVEDHWSLGNVIASNLDIDELVDLFNAWCNRSRREGVYHREIPVGDGILDWDEKDDGINLRLSEPFLVAYIEAQHCLVAGDDDGLELRDVAAKHVMDTFKAIYQCEGHEAPHMNLEDWDQKRVPLDHAEVVRRMGVAKRRRKSLRLRDFMR